MNATSNKPKRRGRWLRWIGLALLVLLVLLGIFHRPIFFEGTRYFIVRAAKQQHLDLSYDASGSIFTTLTISNLRGIPTEQGPIQRLEIGTLNLRYSLIGLIREGLPGLLKLVDVRNAYIEVTPAQPLPPEKERQPQQFKFPALFPDILNLENINFITHGPTGNTELSGLFLSLLPDRAGVLKIQTVDIPGVRRWTEISGATSFRDRNLIITDLVIGPEISLRKFNLDVSKLSEAELGLSLDGSLFDAPIILSAQVSDLNATNRLNLKAESSALSLQRIWQYFNLTVPTTGTLDRLVVSFQGEPTKPSSWTGQANVLLSGATYDRWALGEITLQLDMADQRVKATLVSRLDQENRIDIEANSTLPETFNDFDKVRLNLKAESSALSLQRIGEHLNLTVPVTGTLDRLVVSFQGEPAKPSSWVGEADVLLSGATYDRQALGDTTLRLDMADQRVKATLVSRLDQENRIDIEANSTLPETFNDFDKVSASGHLQVFGPDLVALNLPVIGDLSLNTDFRFEDKKLSTQSVLDSTSLTFSGTELTETHLRLDLSKELSAQADAPPFKDLVSRIEGQIKAVRLQDYVVESVNIALSSSDAKVHLEGLTLAKGANRASLQANYILPADLKSWEREPLEFDLSVDAPDLSALVAPDTAATLKGTLKIAGKGSAKDGAYDGSFVIEGRGIEAMGLIGDLSLNTSFRLENRKLSTQSVFDSSSLAFSGTELTETHLRLDLSKDLQQQAEAPLFKDLISRIEGEIKAVRFQDYVVESVNIALSSSDANVHLERVTLARGVNHASLQANYILPADLKLWGREPLEFDLSVDAPDLSAFVVPDSGATLKGTLKIAGKGSAKDGAYDGSFVIEGRGIETMGMTVHSIDARLDAAENQARLSQLQVVFNEKNVIRGEGAMRLTDPFDYSGALDVQFADLSIFQPLLEQEAMAPALGGALNIVWKGTGDLRAPQHTGDVTIDLTSGKFGDLQDLGAHAKGSYSPQFVNVPDLTVSARGLGEALLSLFWKDNRLSIFDISVRQEKLTLVQGSAELPFYLAEVQHPDRLIPNDKPLKLALQTRELDLRKLFTQLGQKKPPVTGIVNLDVNAGGTLDELAAKATVRATRIQSPDASQLDPATISLDLDFQNDRLSLNGSVQQRLIQPLRISGNLPFDIVAFRNNAKIDTQTPVELQVIMPRSSLAFVSTLVPAIRQSRGTAAIDINVRGTIAQPVLSGEITADLSALRFTDPSLPPIADAALQLNFRRDRITIGRFTGRIGGGSFAASGGIGVQPLDNPTLALRLTTQNALILQNDDLSVRANSDIRVDGPLNAASVTGNVFVTRSAFFRNIDILPIGLPGRPAPQPPQQPVFVSFPQPPLRDWKFDVSIRTQDAFLVQSNLANGRITIDLKLGGTGLRPWMDGTIYIEQLVATLPFSRLQIESGFIYFKRDQPFVPILNLRGTSTIRDYNITVYITGPATAPEAIFSSNPPLPQAEIVSLIATGATPQELSRDPNALAGRAAILLFQKIYRSVFARNKPAPAQDSLLSRVRLDIGTMDPKTGKQAASIGIPLTNQLVLVGGLDVGGNFRGQIKYLVRFK
jgi:autotransporter translocation and assembly factor TamB